MITFFVDPSWRKVGVPHIPLLFPFWGNALTERTPYQHEVFERYSFNTALYTITNDAAVADAVLMPYSHNTTLKQFPDLLDACAAKAHEIKKVLLIDGIGDIEHPVTVPNAVVLRYGGYRFESKQNEIHIPPYADDLLEGYCNGTLALRSKPLVPTVGFAGWATLSVTKTIKVLLKELPNRLHSLFDNTFAAKRKGVFFRRLAVKVLQRSSLVKTRVLGRSSYSGHVLTAGSDTKLLRHEFVDTLLASDYCLDIRGDANSSQRLYEILSLGRIPVIVDTERNYPFSDKVEYRSFALVVDFREIGQLPERVAEFNQSLSPEEFVAMQKRARDAFVKYFRIDAQTEHILNELQAKSLLLSQ